MRQGISFYRALETKMWRSTDNDPASVAIPPFDFHAIDRLVQLSVSEDESWREYFQHNGLHPLVVTYEDLDRAPEDVSQQILSFLGLPGVQKTANGWRHQRQADAITDEWVKRYHSHKGASPTKK